MKAAVLRKLGEAPRFEEFAEPVAGADEVPIEAGGCTLLPELPAGAAGEVDPEIDEVPPGA